MASFGVSDDTQVVLTYLAQGVIFLLLLYSIFILGSLKLAVNTGAAFIATLVPIIYARDFRNVLNPGITLLITATLLVHSVGALFFYQSVPGFDEAAHFFSGAVFAMLAVALVDTRVWKRRRPFNLSDDELILIIVFVAAVVWELYEVLVGVVTTRFFGESFLTTGMFLADTVMDVGFTVLGGIIVGVFNLHERNT